MDINDLTLAAPLFRALNNPDPSAEVLYDGLSGSLVWSDEAPASRPSEWWCIRPVWHARTRIITGQPMKYEDWWLRARELFPEWVGFRTERCSPSASLAELFHQQEQKFIASLEKLDEADGLI